PGHRRRLRRADRGGGDRDAGRRPGHHALPRPGATGREPVLRGGCPVGEPARLRLKVRHYEVDLYGHVNHANYVHYLEAARVEAAFVDKLSALHVVETPPTASGVDPGGPRGTKSRTVSLPRRVESSAPRSRRRAR